MRNEGVETLYTVMIVDDEKLICEGLASKINRIKELNISKVIMQTNSIEAKNLALTIKSDIIITDIKMPGLSGIELMEAIIDDCPDTKFLVLNGHNDFPYVRKSFRLGAIDYLLKPVSTKELKERLSDTIKKLEQERDSHMIIFKDGQDQSNSYPSQIEVAQQFIIDNFSKDISMADVADNINMSYSYFSKLFKEETGMTFSKYLTKIRMEKAKDLLQNPTYRVNEIACMVGYDNLYHFSRAFKSYYGMSPNQFRKSK